MTFLPIVERELRVASRRRGTYGVRLAAAFAALGVGGWIMSLATFQSPGKLGPVLFGTLGAIALICSPFIALAVAADCLSVEKRENTLGLLFLTDLRGYDIVLGKLAAHSLGVFYGLLAIFPVLCIPLLAGGVSGAEFARVVLVCLNNLLFALALGIFCSALCRDERHAAGLGLSILLLLAVALPTLAVRLTPPYSLWTMLCSLPSPSFSAVFAFDEVRRSATPSSIVSWFLPSVLCLHGLSWLLLLLASLIVPRAWQDKADGPLLGRWRAWKTRLSFGPPHVRQKTRARMLDLNPVFWLAGRDRTRAALVWFFLAAMVLLWGYGCWREPLLLREESVFVFTALTLHTVLKLWVGAEASRLFCAERNSGALELLLATPLSVRQILHGQLLALWKQFAAPAALVVLADFVFLLMGRSQEHWVLSWVALLAMFIADLVTLSWVGMWTALRHRTATRAAAAALVRILVLPSLAFLLVVSLAATARTSTFSDAAQPIIIWLIIGLSFDAYFALQAQAQLQANFRRLATQRYADKKLQAPTANLH